MPLSTCSRCGNLLYPHRTSYGDFMRCSNDHIQPLAESTVNIQNHEQAKPVSVLLDEHPLAVHDHPCKRCGHDKAELIEISCSYSDEDNMYRMKCGKCGLVEQLEGKVK